VTSAADAGRRPTGPASAFAQPAGSRYHATGPIFPRERTLAMRISGWLRWILGAGILAAFVAWVEHESGWGRVLAGWSVLQPLDWIGILALVAAGYLARAARVQAAFPAAAGRFAACLRVMLWHNGLNNLLPVRSGEAAFPLLMKRIFEVKLETSLPALLWFRALDLYVLGAVAWAALAPGRIGRAPAAAALALWLPLPFLAFAVRGAVLERLRDRSGRPAVWLSRLVAGISDSRPALGRVLGWTAANWTAKLIAFAWLLGRLADLELGAAILGSLGGEPVHGIAGAGTYEAGVVAVLLPLGIPVERSLTAAVDLHLLILGASLVGLALALASGAAERAHRRPVATTADPPGANAADPPSPAPAVSESSAQRSEES
jgi:hypothetical protein